MTAELWGIALYVAAQLALGMWICRKVSSSSDFFVAGRSLGLGLTALSLFATWFGAETCMGSAGAIFSKGLSGARADPFGYSLCLVGMGLLLARQLWKRQLTTLGDLYRQRYGAGVERLAVILLVPPSMMWAGAQLRAFGQIIAAASPWSVTSCIAIATLVVLLYTAWGGLLADVFTDVVQGVALVLGLVIVTVVVVLNHGGIEAALTSIAPERWSLVASDETWLQRLDTWMIPILGSLVAQELVARILAARSPDIARRASFASAGIYLLVGAMPVLLGLLGPQLVGTLDEPEQLIPTLAARFLPYPLYVIFCGALVSAILSTVDSALLACSALVSRMLASTRLAQTDRQQMRLARGLVAVFGLGAFGLAVSSESIYGLVELASSFASAGILVITFFGLYSTFGDARAATVALLVGMIATPLGEYVLEVQAPYLFSVGAALLSFVVVAAAIRLVSIESTPARLGQ